MDSDTIIILVVGSFLSLALTVLFQKPLESRWERLAGHLKAKLPGRLRWLADQSVRATIIGLGLFLFLITAIFQYTPVTMATTGYFQHYPLYATIPTLAIWELVVYAMFRGSLRLVRFRNRRRQDS